MKKKSCFIWFKNEDSMIVNVNDDMNRPNNDNCDTVLERWIYENYGEEVQNTLN